jgi:hypothetical protein
MYSVLSFFRGAQKNPFVSVSLSDLAPKHLWVLRNPRYLEKAILYIQDHQALKTIWTTIMNVFRTEFFKDQAPTIEPFSASEHGMQGSRSMRDSVEA